MSDMKEILVADDEDHISKLIKYKLTKEGFSVHIVRNGQEAVESFGLKNWSMMILDIMMPLKDGWQVLRELKSSPFAEIPVLVLSAKGHQDDVIHASELGAVQYLKKPFDPVVLFKMVQKMVGDP
jgi:DNA-binding response OmpR family regulator